MYDIVLTSTPTVWNSATSELAHLVMVLSYQLTASGYLTDPLLAWSHMEYLLHLIRCNGDVIYDLGWLQMDYLQDT